MTPDALHSTLIAIIILLVGGYWVQLIYRLHKAEQRIDEMQRDFSKALLDAANAAVAAANAIAAAAGALRNKR